MTTSPPAEPPTSERLDDFEQELDRLKIKGGDAEPERRLVAVGFALILISFVWLFVCYNGSRGAEDPREQTDYLVLALPALLLGIFGVVMWARYTLTRYLRYWLLRTIYEERAQTDRVVGAIRGGAPSE